MPACLICSPSLLPSPFPSCSVLLFFHRTSLPRSSGGRQQTANKSAFTALLMNFCSWVWAFCGNTDNRALKIARLWKHEAWEPQPLCQCLCCWGYSIVSCKAAGFVIYSLRFAGLKNKYRDWMICSWCFNVLGQGADGMLRIADKSETSELI